MHRLAEIYMQNQELELESRLYGSKAKTLINRCKEALRIIQTEFASNSYEQREMPKDIQVLEDELASLGFVITKSYNLGARVDIHLCCNEHGLLK